MRAARAKLRIFNRDEPTPHVKVLDYCCIPYRNNKPVHAVGFTQLLVYGAFIVLGIAVLYAFLSPPPPKVRGERVNLRKIVDSLNHPCLHDVRIIDKQGRIVCIEHILRLPACVVLIGTVAATAKGEVTGNEHTRSWKITPPGFLHHLRQSPAGTPAAQPGVQALFPPAPDSRHRRLSRHRQFPPARRPKALSAPPTSRAGWTRS